MMYICEVLIRLFKIINGSFNVPFCNRRKMRTINLHVSINFFADLHDLKRDRLSFTIAIQPKNQNMAFFRQSSDIVRNFLLFFIDCSLDLSLYLHRNIIAIKNACVLFVYASVESQEVCETNFYIAKGILIP